MSKKTVKKVAPKKTVAKEIEEYANKVRESEENLVEGLKKGEAIEKLIRSGYTYAEAEKYWSDNGARSKGRGFRNSFYKYITEEERTEEEAVEFIETYGTPNDKKHEKHYVSILEVTVAIRKQYSE